MIENYPAPGDDGRDISNVVPYRRVVDQVTRHLAFSAAHPEVDIRFHHNTGRWEAAYPGGPNIHSIELKDLLDRLDEHFT